MIVCLYVLVAAGIGVAVLFFVGAGTSAILFAGAEEVGVLFLESWNTCRAVLRATAAVRGAVLFITRVRAVVHCESLNSC